MENMTREGSKYFIIGVSEGYLDVRLEKIIEQDQYNRQCYLRGYYVGKNKKESLEEDKLNNWKKNREDYISAVGFKVGYENYPATDVNLTNEEKLIFEAAYTEGVNRKALEDSVCSFKKERK